MMLYRKKENKWFKIPGWLLVIMVLFPLVNYGQADRTNGLFVTLENNRQISENIFTKQAMPLPAGHTIKLEENMEVKGVWDTVGQVVSWCIGFYVPGSPALSVYFSNLDLSENDTLFVYPPDKKNHAEMMTKNDNDIYYGTGFLAGDSLVIELRSPDKVIPFKIAEIGIANSTFSHYNRDFGGAGDCEVPVNCEEGVPWQNEKDGVARILVKEATNLFWCTGSLVNNTEYDGKPYFLTANHCGEYAGDLDYRAWVFYFNYESDDCDIPVTEPDKSHKIVGARLLAHSKYDVDKAADFKLLLLNRDLPENYHAFYNGWDRSGNVSVSGVTIHHPQGDIKMISTYEVPIVSTNYGSPDPDNEGMYWQVKWAETVDGHGVTEAGSSGSPLFNKEGLIIGALTGGEASCSNPDKPDYYGKFSYAWHSEGADSSEQLKYWLDPKNTNVLSVKGTNLDTILARANFSSDVTEITMGEQVQFVNYSTGNISGYIWEFEGGEPSYSEKETPEPVQYNTFGTYSVTLIATSANGNDTLQRSAYIKVLPMMVPNPSAKGVFRLSFGKEMPGNIEIAVYDVFGRKVSPVFTYEENGSLYVDISLQAAGVYLISVKADENISMLKAFYVKKGN